MQRRAAVYLWDAERAAALALEFVEDRSGGDPSTDSLLRAGAEREIQIIGEALNQLSRLNPAYASRMPNLPRIVGLRNILVHGYHMVVARLWRVVHEDVTTYGPSCKNCCAR